MLAFSAAMGLLWLSTVPLTSGLVALMFGTRHVGMLFGFVFLSHQIGAFIGVWLGGVVYEATGSYDLMWWLCVALGVRRRRGPPPDLGAPRAGSGTLSRMRVRSHVAIVLALSAAAFGSAYWQASVAPADSEAGQTARFVCPLH